MKLSVIIITCILSFKYGEFRPSTGPSIIALPFNATEDANAIISAMEKSSSENKDRIIDILTSKTIAQRLAIGEAYAQIKKQEFKGDIAKYFNQGLNSDKNMLEILKTTPEFLASRIHRSVMKNRDNGYMSIIITSSSELLRNVSTAYQNEYKQEMAIDISDHNLGNVEMTRFISKLISYNNTTQRSDHAKVDNELTEELVRVIPTSKRHCTLDDSKDLYEMMQKASFAQIKAVGELFQKTSGSPVDAIRKYCDGDTNKPFHLIMNFSMDPFKYFAHEINEDIKGDNDDEDSACPRILISRSEIDMADIRTAYDAAYEHGLEWALRKYYRDRQQMILTALANGNQV